MAHTIKSQLWGCGDRRIPGSCWTPSLVVALTSPKPVRGCLKNKRHVCNDIQGLASLCMLICSAPPPYSNCFYVTECYFPLTDAGSHQWLHKVCPTLPHTMQKESEFQCSVFCLCCNCDVANCLCYIDWFVYLLI